MSPTHVIVGAGGAIAKLLAQELVSSGIDTLVVSRSGTALDDCRSARADATDYESLRSVVPDGSVVHLVLGLTYDSRVWRTLWPKVMDTAIRVCGEKGALLVFFDNVYMYGPVDGPMTEETPHRPTSEKGRVRAQIAESFLEAMSAGSVRGLIARSADFYGPFAGANGIPNNLILSRMIAGKNGQWLGPTTYAHSLTYTGDCGSAMVKLAQDESAHNQVWHLPTAAPPVSMDEFATIAAEYVEAPSDLRELSLGMLRLAGLFSRTIKETIEMRYQNTQDYIFDSSKFCIHFNVTPTTYRDGIAATIEHLRSSN